MNSMLISQPAFFAAVLTAAFCGSLAIVSAMEELSYAQTSLTVLFFGLLALACLGGVVVCIFWPVVGVLE